MDTALNNNRDWPTRYRLVTNTLQNTARDLKAAEARYVELKASRNALSAVEFKEAYETYFKLKQDFEAKQEEFLLVQNKIFK
jgi:hypothetical protein